MYHIHYLNKISPKGTELWGEDYTLTDDVAQAEGILVRHFTAPRLKPWLRVTVGTPEDMDKVTDALIRLICG